MLSQFFKLFIIFYLFSFFYSCVSCGKGTDTNNDTNNESQDDGVEKSINIKGSVDIDDISEHIEISPLPIPIDDDVAGEVTSGDITVASLIQRSDLLLRSDLISRSDLLQRSDYFKGETGENDEYLLTYAEIDEEGNFSLEVPENTTFYLVVGIMSGDDSYFKHYNHKKVITLDNGESLMVLGKILSENSLGLTSTISFPSEMTLDVLEIGFCERGDDGFESSTSIYSYLDDDGDGIYDDTDDDSDNNEIIDKTESYKILVDGVDEYLKKVSWGVSATFSISLTEALSNIVFYASIPSGCEFNDNGDSTALLTCTFIEETSQPVTLIAKSDTITPIYADLILNVVDNESSGTYWKLTGSDVNDESNLGGSLSISGNYVAVGDVNDSNLGAVYVYNYDGTTWNEVAKLTSDSPSSNDLFSDSIAIESNGDSATCVVTATMSYGDSLYVFEGNTDNWTKKFSTVITDLSRNSGSGGMWGGSSGYSTGYESLSISGNSFIVGVPRGGSTKGTVYEGVPEKSDMSGTAYIYTKNGENWEEETRISASDASMSSLFGSSVHISGDVAIVGAPGKNNNKGGAYIFIKKDSVWKEVKLDNPDNAYQFGASVAISGNYAIVGEYGGSMKPYGKAYIYKCDSDNLSCNLEDTFSISKGNVTVDIDGNYALAGATSGKIYLFKNGENGWNPIKRKSGNPLIGFGQNLAVSSDFYIISASTVNSVYTYKLK